MNLVIAWNKILLDAIRQLGKLPNPQKARGGPPQVARSISMVHTAIYNAWTVFDPVASPAYGTAAKLPPNIKNQAQAISQAASVVLLNQFPLSIFTFEFRTRFKQQIDDLLAKVGVAPDDPSMDPTTSVGVGNLAAKAVLDFRSQDNSNEEHLFEDNSVPKYTPRNAPATVILPASEELEILPDHWQPLTYLNSENEAATPAFIAPHWQKVSPFALSSADQFRPTKRPQPPLSQGFIDQAKYVIDIQANLTPRQKVIAEYWADGPNSELPPGHWTEFAAYVAERDNHHLKPNPHDESVKLFFAVTNAVMDASIATWDAKREFDYVRPITAIRYLFRGQIIKGWAGPGKGIREIPAETWIPFQIPTFPTPPFSEFTSGHSGFSMAAATVLKLFTGSDKFGFFYAQKEPLKADPDVHVTDIILHWPTFSAAAREAGDSRLFGGIHFYEGNVVGLEIGKKVGDLAYKKASQLWSGITAPKQSTKKKK